MTFRANFLASLFVLASLLLSASEMTQQNTRSSAETLKNPRLIAAGTEPISMGLKTNQSHGDWFYPRSKDESWIF